jgi:hypothetical protein
MLHRIDSKFKTHQQQLHAAAVPTVSFPVRNYTVLVREVNKQSCCERAIKEGRVHTGLWCHIIIIIIIIII